MKVVYTKVVADLFHFGHVNFLKKAKELGDKLVVQVVNDERVSQAKRKSVMNQFERAEVVRACRYVDEVMLDGPKVITLDFMKQTGYDIYAFSYSDDNELKTKLKDCPDLPLSMTAVIEYTTGISTTQILERISRNEQ